MRNLSYSLREKRHVAIWKRPIRANQIALRTKQKSYWFLRFASCLIVKDCPRNNNFGHEVNLIMWLICHDYQSFNTWDYIKFQFSRTRFVFVGGVDRFWEEEGDIEIFLSEVRVVEKILAQYESSIRISLHISNTEAISSIRTIIIIIITLLNTIVTMCTN